ncbi:MAG TPA: S8 family serine peptidase [Candidatus Thermoplasmatota archaeon]|jgi:serine protease AprX|nr:S8 family serine peptidase [Candidatus Thermoplasmatota archaeon]
MVRARAAVLAVLAVLLPALAPQVGFSNPANGTALRASLEPVEDVAARAPGAAAPGDDPLLCILDSGVDTDHVDLDDGKVVAWRDFLRGRAEPYDDNGHGTHVAGIAAASGEAGRPGAAPHARLAVGKVMDDAGHGTSAAAARGVAWCVAQGALVINLSLEEQDCAGHFGLDTAIAQALRDGVLLVTTAGNRGDAPCAIHTPGSLADAITVGALAGASLAAKDVASFSGRGDGGVVKPDVLAPGQGIRAAHAGTRDALRAMDGTSMAAPFVSAVVALLREAHPGASPDLVARALRATARDGGAPGPDPAWGWGAVQPSLALGWLDDHDPALSAAAPGARRQLAALA